MTADTPDHIITELNRIATQDSPRVEDILPYTRHAHGGIRAAAYQTLWFVPCPATLTVLLDAIRTDGDPVAREAAARALGRYIWSGLQLDSTFGSIVGDDGVSLEEVAGARMVLSEVLTDPRSHGALRQAALEALSFDADASVHQQIAALWKSDSLEDRQVAIRCMGRSGHPQWRPVILGTLSAGGLTLLKAAIEAAGEGCLEDAEGMLLELAQGSDRPHALAAIWALRNVIHTHTGRKVLEKLGRSKDPEIKREARASLEDLDAIDVHEREDTDDD